MPIILKLLDDTPFMYGSYEGIIRCEDVKQATAEAFGILQRALGERLLDAMKYYIVDVRKLDIKLSELPCVVGFETSGSFGTFSDPKSYGVIIGTNLFIRAFQKLMHRQGIDPGRLAIFLTEEEAFAAIRARMEADSQG